jgi:DNA-binding transcriptional LysR family regulator
MRAPNHLNALRAVEAVGRRLSYVGAAEELKVTPAAIGSMVHGIEETLGIVLFHRSQVGQRDSSSPTPHAARCPTCRPASITWPAPWIA